MSTGRSSPSYIEIHPMERADGATEISMSMSHLAGQVPIVGMCTDCKSVTTGYKIARDQIGERISGSWPCSSCKRQIGPADYIWVTFFDEEGGFVQALPVRQPDDHTTVSAFTFEQLRELHREVQAAVESARPDLVAAAVAALPDPVKKRFRWSEMTNGERIALLTLILGVLTVWISYETYTKAAGPSDEQIDQQIERVHHEWEQGRGATPPAPDTPAPSGP